MTAYEVSVSKLAAYDSVTAFDLNGEFDAASYQREEDFLSLQD